jgi:hypothetical protein
LNPVSWASRAIWCDGHMGAPLQVSDQFPQGPSASPSRRSSHRIDGEKPDGSVDQLPIPVTTDQDGDPSPPPAQKGHHEQTAVPESDDHGFFVAIPEKRLMDLEVYLVDPHGKPNEVDETKGKERDQGKKESPAQSPQKTFSSRGHFLVSSDSHPICPTRAGDAMSEDPLLTAVSQLAGGSPSRPGSRKSICGNAHHHGFCVPKLHPMEPAILAA